MSRAKRERLQALRDKHRPQAPAPAVPPGCVSVNGQSWPWQSVLQHVATAREQADLLEREAVIAARGEGVSWDRLSLTLGGKPSGEQLRRRHAGL